jgi:predicted RNA-binding Zn ribbon-like protein
MKTKNSASIHMTVVSRSFSAGDLVGGHPVLDLVNTVTARNTATPLDWLDSYERLLEWATLANITEEGAIRVLSKQATGSPNGARDALARLKQFREALHRAYAAVMTGTRVPEAVLHEIGMMWREAQSRRGLEYIGKRIESRVSASRSGLDLIRDSLADGAVELLRSLPADRARVCSGDRCGWLFIDSSKGGQRVWCDMATCGNAAKTRRHGKSAQRGRRSGRIASGHPN